ncbi:MAG: protein kinase [Verrucomicrobiae bacterium]|nr:protein kinase [Verrucomicrobiae bacterium]
MTTSAGGMCPRCLLSDSWHDSSSGSAGQGDVEPEFTIEHLQNLFPNLTIQNLIARGGMGSTYLVIQKGLNRPACLKVLSPGLAGNPEFIVRFRQEAELIGQLNDPGIVTVFDASQVDEVIYILMEYVEGTNLKEFSQTTNLTPETIIGLLRQVTSGLAVAHLSNVVHRDIKPANILIQRDTCQAKLSDFGLAKLETNPHNGLTTVGQTMGTPRYMAPEQWEDAKAADARSDVYALGVVFYELATGQLPTGHFGLPSALTKGAFTTEFDQLICKALSTNPDDRYRSAEEMYLAAERLGHQKPLTRILPAMGVVIALIVVGIIYFPGKDSVPPPEPAPLVIRGSSNFRPKWSEIYTTRAEFFKGLKSQSSLGRSLAITGNRIIAGAPQGGPKHLDITGSGYAMVQNTGNDPKTEQMEFAKSSPIVIAGDESEGALFGYELAASSVEGRPYTVIGAPGHANTGNKKVNQGEAALYFLNADGEWDHKAKLASDHSSIEAPLFGFSVAAYDRFTVIGAPGFKDSKDRPSGAVAVYEIGTDGSLEEHWIPKPKTRDSKINTGKDVWDFGFSVVIDDRFLIVGSPLDSQNKSDEGAVFVYQLEQEGTWNLKQTLKDPAADASEQFGYRLALYDQWLLVTSYSTRRGERAFPVGHVNVFHYDGGSADSAWKFHQRLEVDSDELPTGLQLERFGYGIDVSGDYLAIGAPTTLQSGIGHHGIVFLYALDKGKNMWEPHTQILPRIGGTRFGVSVKFGQDFLAIGSIFFPPTEVDNKAGGVFCFDLKNFEKR